METQKEKAPHYKKAILLNKAQQLPLGVYMAVLCGRTVSYKGTVIKSSILIGSDGVARRGTIIGGYSYIVQDTLGESPWAKLACAGHKVLHIYNTTTGAYVASVVDEKIVKAP